MPIRCPDNVEVLSCPAKGERLPSGYSLQCPFNLNSHGAVIRSGESAHAFSRERAAPVTMGWVYIYGSLC